MKWYCWMYGSDHNQERIQEPIYAGQKPILKTSKNLYPIVFFGGIFLKESG